MNGVYIAIFLLSVLISSVSQILLKASANRRYESKMKEYLNLWVVVAYVMFLGSSLMTILAYRGVSLSMGPVLETTGYLWVTILGYMLLKEKVSKRKMLGLSIIVCGIIMSGVS